jgi:hypothetical protein
MHIHHLFPACWRSAPLAAGVLLGLLGTSPSVRSAPPPLPAAEEAKVHDAMAWGVRYLLQNQGPFGTWAQERDNYKVAYAALPGLTLLECGVPPSHPAVRAAAAYVRGSYLSTEGTYEAALAILFLDHLYQYNRDLSDHLEEALTDRRIIQVLAIRLIAGQTKTGGWTYTCKQMSTADHLKLLSLVKDPKLPRYRIPERFRGLPVFQDPDKLMLKPKPPKKKPRTPPGQDPAVAKPPTDSDNSNTHFALLGLWVAQRYGVGVERSFRLLGKRFRTGQNSNGSWGYTWAYGGKVDENAAMTCAGLLGLVMQYGFKGPAETQGVLSGPRGVAQLVGFLDFRSPLARVAAAYQAQRSLDADAARRKQEQDGAIGFALSSLGAHIGDPAGRTTGLPMPNLYFLWAVERVAVIYGLTTIAGKDWYRWGAEALVANQQPDGYWEKSGYPGSTPVLDTCFALFFLKRANLAADLTAQLRNDPNALAKLKRDQAAPPAPAPPAPTPASPPPVVKTAPPVVTLPPLPAPVPEESAAKTVAEPTPAPAPVAKAPAAEPAGRKLWLWIALLAVALLFIGAGVALTIMGRRMAPAEPPKPGKGKKKVGAQSRNGHDTSNGKTVKASPPGLAGKPAQSKGKAEGLERGSRRHGVSSGPAGEKVNQRPDDVEKKDHQEP